MNSVESSRNSGEGGFTSVLASKGVYYDSADDHEDEGDESINDLDDPSSKKRRLNDDQRLQRCRERNRIHARNTRERKRAQMDLMQQRIQELSDEKNRLENYEPEVSVASILMSLSSNQVVEPKMEMNMDDGSRTFAADTIERIKSQISATLSDDEELELNSDILGKDKAGCSTAELEMIRRERNRMHAKKTRLRKKKMLGEMETIIEGLERDIHGLRQKHSLGPEESLPGCTQSPRLGVSMTIGTAGGAAAGTSKFTGFRHVHRSDSMGSGKVVSGSVARKEAASVPASTSAAPTPTPGAAPDQAVSPPAYASSSGFVFPPSLLPPNVAMAMGNLGMGMGMGGLGMSMDFGYLQALVAHALPATAAMDSEQRLQQQRDLLRGYASFTSAHRDTTSAATAASASGLSSGSGGSQLGSTSHGSNSSSGTSRNGSSGDLTTYFAPSLENIKYAGDHHLKRHEQEQKQRWEQESVGGGGIVPEALLDCQPISTQGKKAVHISEGNGGVAAAAAAASAATAMKSARGLNSGNTSRCNSSDSEESASPSPAPPSQQQLPEAVRTSQMQMQQQPHLLSSSSTTTSLAVPVVHP